jgi:hypothetical protein
MFNHFFSENRTVYEMMSKNIAETEGPQITSQYGAYALHAGLVRLHARTPPRPRAPPPHTHTHKHRKYLLLIAFPQQQ